MESLPIRVRISNWPSVRLGGCRMRQLHADGDVLDRRRPTPGGLLGSVLVDDVLRRSDAFRWWRRRRQGHRRRPRRLLGHDAATGGSAVAPAAAPALLVLRRIGRRSALLPTTGAPGQQPRRGDRQLRPQRMLVLAFLALFNASLNPTLARSTKWAPIMKESILWTLHILKRPNPWSHQLTKGSLIHFTGAFTTSHFPRYP